MIAHYMLMSSVSVMGTIERQLQQNLNKIENKIEQQMGNKQWL